MKAPHFRRIREDWQDHSHIQYSSLVFILKVVILYQEGKGKGFDFEENIDSDC